MKILVAIAGSSFSDELLRYAIDEAKIKKAKLSVVCSRRSEKTRKEAIKDEDILKGAEKIMEDAGIEPDAHLLVRGASPATDIVKFAKENSCDHIIIGHHHHHIIGVSLHSEFLGSVADEVVHKAHCPVTIFRK